MAGGSHVVTTYFFSLEDFENEFQSTGPSTDQGAHLSLGPTIGAWHNETSQLANELYLQLVEDSRILLTSEAMGVPTFRQAEILIGSLALKLSRRLARSKKQIRTLKGHRPSPFSRLPASIALSLKGAANTSESYELLISREFSDLVDSIAVYQFFGINTSTSVILRHPSQAAGSQSDVLGSFDKISPRRRFMKTLFLSAQKLLARSASRSSISIVGSYLGRSAEIVLSALLGQPPSLLEVRPPVPARKTPNEDKLFDLQEYGSDRKISMFLMKLLLPLSLSEGFDSTLSRAYSLGFPRDPSVIFTSNSYHSDDEFKAHLANAIPRATYVLGQHGNTYGVSRKSELCPEQNTADFFLSWGWEGDGVIPFGQIKPRIRGKPRARPRYITLFLRHDSPHYFLQADMHGPNTHYFASVEQLCKELNSLCIKTVLILHASTSNIRRQFFESIASNMEFIEISRTKPTIKKLMSSGSAIVFTYDSTGMLEMGASGLPFFCFAPDGIELVKEEFLVNYEALERAGLLCRNPEECAQLISEWITAAPSLAASQLKEIESFTRGIAFYPRNKIWTLMKLLRGLKTKNLFGA